MAEPIVYIDPADGLKRVMNNKGLYVKLLNKFKNESYLVNLSDSLSAEDFEKAQTAAHTIKGVAGNLSLVELQKQAQEIESHIKNKSVETSVLESFTICYQETLIEVTKVIEEYGG